MNRNILSLTAIFFCFSRLAFAQNTVDELVNDFFKIYEQESPTHAMQYAFNTNEYFSGNNSGVNTLLDQLVGTLQVIGDYCGYEKLTERSLGSKLKYKSYMIYYDRQPLRFIFEFYKPKDKWVFHNVMFDDKYEEELKNGNATTQEVSGLTK